MLTLLPLRGDGGYVVDVLGMGGVLQAKRTALHKTTVTRVSRV